MKKVKIVVASKESDITKTLISESIIKLTKISKDFTYSFYSENSNSLASVYNKEIKNKDNKDYILLFVHDDVVLEDLFLYEKLNKAMEKYDMVGLAGIKSPIEIKKPALWHLSGNRQQLSGAVAHFDNNIDKRFMTSFGVMPERVIFLDGVFLAINNSKFLEKDVFFDEECPSKYHFYDMIMCLNANRAGLKLATYPIWITHKSHGLVSITEDWEKGQEYLLTKFKPN